MREALHAEWTKLCTVPSTGWLLLACVALTVTLGAAAVAATCAFTGCDQDPAGVSLMGTYLGQAAAATLAVLAIGGEYSTGMIRVTLAAMPRRGAVLAAKAAVLTGLVLAAGGVAVAGSVLAGRLILLGHGFTAAPAPPPLSMAAGSVISLALIALLSLGAATAVRDSAAAIGVVLGVLYVPSIIAALVPDPRWHRLLQQVAPMTAGLGGLAAWAAAALAVGGLLLWLRDA